MSRKKSNGIFLLFVILMFIWLWLTPKPEKINTNVEFATFFESANTLRAYDVQVRTITHQGRTYDIFYNNVNTNFEVLRVK